MWEELVKIFDDLSVIMNQIATLRKDLSSLKASNATFDRVTALLRKGKGLNRATSPSIILRFAKLKLASNNES